MPAVEVAQKIKVALSEIKAAELTNPHLVEVLDLTEKIVDSMKMFFQSLDSSIYAEFRSIRDHIARTRDEISALRPNDIRTNRLPIAGAELDAVVRDTETATEELMSEAEAVMELEPTDLDTYKADVDAAMLRMIEACSFQDITGQRVSKVVDALSSIEARIERFASVMGVADAVQEASAQDERKAANLLNGPAIGGPETAQDAIDKLFDEGDPSALGQDAIDELFD